MTKGDTVLIDYNTSSGLQKVATFLEYDAENNVFSDASGKFVLTNSFINKHDIKLTVIED